MKRLFCLLLLVCVVACGVDSRSEHLGQVSSNLDGATSLPFPIAHSTDTTTSWPGTTADLYVADAWAACSFMRGAASSADDVPDLTLVDSAANVVATNPRPATPNDGYHDDYLETVLGMMSTTTCSAGTAYQNWLARWYSQRTTANCNYSTDLKTTSTVPLDKQARAMIAPLARTGTAATYSTNFYGGQPLDAMIRQPGINACIAYRLRQLAPGGANGAAFLLSNNDQLDLLERTVERALIAVLGYSKLVQLAKTPPDADSSAGTYHDQLELANTWLRNDAAAKQLLPIQFHEAIQTLTASAKELAEFYGRNASAVAPWTLGPDKNYGLLSYDAALTRPDKYWAKSGWIDRVMTLLYGTPYKSSAPLPLGPTYNPIPYIQLDTDSPKVQQAVQLARQLDVVDLKKGTATNSVDIPATSLSLYQALEAGLETQSCSTRDGMGACAIVSPASIPDPSSNAGSYLQSRLYLVYGLKPEDIAAAATRLSQESIDFTSWTPNWWLATGVRQPSIRGWWSIRCRHASCSPP